MNNTKIKICISALFALLSFFAFFSDHTIGTRELAMQFAQTENILSVTLVRFMLMLPTHHFGGIVFFAGSFFLFYRHELLPLRKYELIFSVSLTVAHFVGINFTFHDSFYLLTDSSATILYSMVLIAGFLSFFYVAVCFLLNKLKNTSFESDSGSKFTSLFLEKRPFVLPFCFFLVAWLPYFFLYFPGNLINDAVHQLSHFIGIFTVTHHPVVSSIFMGALYSLGLAIGNANVGLGLITVTHNLLMSAAFALSLVFMNKWGVPSKIRLAAMLFFAFFPLFGIWAQTILKDTHASPLVLIFVLLYIDVIRNYSRKGLILCALAAVFASLFRHEIIYVVAPAMLALAFLPKLPIRKRLFRLAAVLMVFACTQLINIGAMNLINTGAMTIVGSGSTPNHAFLFIPFQQTARFIRDHELTENDRYVLATTFRDYHLLRDIYNARLSDPVSSHFLHDADINAYFRVWLSMGRRAPLTFLEAAIAMSFSYVVPFGPDWMIIWHESSHDYVRELGRPEIGYAFSNEVSRRLPLLFIELLYRVPLANLFLHTGNYTWAMAFLVLFLIKRNEKMQILYFLPALMIVLACMASPVHGFWRYYLPILFMFPTLVGLVLTDLR